MYRAKFNTTSGIIRVRPERNDYITVDGYLNFLTGYGIVSDFPITISTTTLVATGAVISQSFMRAESYFQAYGNQFLFSNNSGFDNFTNPSIIRATGNNIAFQVSTVVADVVSTNTTRAITAIDTNTQTNNIRTVIGGRTYH